MIKINLKIDLSYNKQSNSKKNHLAKKEGGTLAGRLVASIDTVRQLFLSLIFNCVSQILNIKTSCCNGISIQKWLVLFRKNWFNLLYSTSLSNICSNCLSSLTCGVCFLNFLHLLCFYTWMIPHIRRTAIKLLQKQETSFNNS